MEESGGSFDGPSPEEIDAICSRARDLAFEDDGEILLTEHDIIVKTWCYPKGKSVPAVVITMNHYITSNSATIPCEIAMTSFSIEQGMTSAYCTVVDPIEFPQSYGVDGLKNAEFIGIPVPPFDPHFQDFKRIVTEIEEFIKKNSFVDEDVQKQPFLFCYGKDMNWVKQGLKWLYGKTDKKKFSFKLYRLEHLLVTLALGGLEKISREGSNKKKLQAVMKSFSDIVNESSGVSSSASSSTGFWKKQKLEQSVASYFSSSGISKESYSTFGQTTGGRKLPRCSMDKLMTHPYAALGGFIYEYQAAKYLSDHDLEFVYIEELACNIHRGIGRLPGQLTAKGPEERFIHCALTRVRNQVYLALDALLVNFSEVKAKKWHHYPERGSERKQKKQE